MRELLINYKGLFYDDDDDDDDHECGIIMRRKMTKPAPFLLKTYMLVDDTSTDDMLSWTEDGNAFVVWQPAEFARDLLPTLFKHSNFSSFVRQLNTYGFRKVTTMRWEFQNDMFRKNKQELLVEIRRRKTWRNRQRSLAATANLHTGSDIRSSSTTSSSSELNYLIDENKKLKKENGVLCSELNAMKRKCQELFRLVALFGNEVDEDGDSDGDDGNNKNRPKLFGVRLDLQDESERKRRKKLALDYTRTL